MKYYLGEFYKFKIFILISVLLGAITSFTVTNLVGEELEVTYKDSFKVLMLNRETSLSYFLINSSKRSDIYKIDLTIKPKSNNPYIIPTFTSILFSKEQINSLSKLIKMNEITLANSLNIFYRYPSTQSFGNRLDPYNIYQDSNSVVQIIFTNNFPGESVGIVVNEIKVILDKLGLEDSDYYFDNEEIIKQNSLESPEKFRTQLNSLDLSRSDFREEFNQYFNEKQFMNRKEKYSGTFQIEFRPAGSANFIFLGSDSQELADFKSYTMDFMVKVLDLIPSSNLQLNYFLLVEGEVKTETLQTDRRILEHIALGGLIGLFASLIIVYGNILRKDIRKEIKKANSR